MPVWWGNNGFQWGWVMRLFQRVAGVAAACFLGVTAGPVGAQSVRTDAERVQALVDTIKKSGQLIPDTSSYLCSNGNTTIYTDGTGGVVQEEKLTLWQGPSKVGPVLPFHNLYLRTEAVLLRNGSVSIIPTYAVIPQGQEDPLSEGVPLPTVVFPYISSHANKTPPAILVGMEKAVRETCSNTPPQTIGPVLRALSGQSTFQM